MNLFNGCLCRCYFFRACLPRLPLLKVTHPKERERERSRRSGVQLAKGMTQDTHRKRGLSLTQFKAITYPASLPTSRRRDVKNKFFCRLTRLRRNVNSRRRRLDNCRHGSPGKSQHPKETAKKRNDNEKKGPNNPKKINRHVILLSFKNKCNNNIMK